MSAVAWVVGGIGVAGIIAVVVFYIRRALSNSVALDERDAALKVEAERVAKEESAAVRARADRAKELNEKLATVTDSADAVAILREELSRARGTPADNVVSGPAVTARP